jgi:glutathione S-transferase
MIRIYDFARGARGLRVVWQCEEMGLPYRFETVSFPPSAAYRALNPLGSVPFLQDDAGVAINESIAMMLYLAQKYGPTPLLPGNDDPTLGRVLQMTVFGEAAIGAQMNSLLAAHFAAPEADKRKLVGAHAGGAPRTGHRIHGGHPGRRSVSRRRRRHPGRHLSELRARDLEGRARQAVAGQARRLSGTAGGAAGVPARAQGPQLAASPDAG